MFMTRRNALTGRAKESEPFTTDSPNKEGFWSISCRDVPLLTTRSKMLSLREKVEKCRRALNTMKDNVNKWEKNEETNDGTIMVDLYHMQLEFE